MKMKISKQALISAYGLPAPKTADQLKAESKAAAMALPSETKRKFWEAMTLQHMNVGQARELAGIDDIMVAAQLVILCHEEVTFFRPKTVAEIV